MKSKILAKLVAMAVVFGLAGGMAFAAATANDTASNYTGVWSTSPSNLGTGFGAWNVTVNNNDGPPYVGTYLAGSGDTPIVDGGGNAWATYANTTGGSGQTGSIIFVRPFTAGASGSSSLYNQTLSFDLGSGGVGPGQGNLSVQVGNAFKFQYDGTQTGDNMTFNDPTSGLITNSVGFADLNAGLVITLSVSGALNSTTEGYTFTVSPFAGGSPLYQRNGTFDSSVYDTSSFTYTDDNTTGNGYFNQLDITAEAVPEPVSAAFLGFFGLASLLAIRRRK